MAASTVTAADVLRVAGAEVGYVEHGGADGRSGNITKYWAHTEPRDQGASWCADFVSWVFRKAGAPLPAIDVPFGYIYCPDAVAYAKRNGLWNASGSYKPGWIIFYCWDGSGTAEHTGIVVDDRGAGGIYTIEGNTSPTTAGSQSNGGGVYRKVRPHGPTVLGCMVTDLAKPAAVARAKRTPISHKVALSALLLQTRLSDRKHTLTAASAAKLRQARAAITAALKK